MRAGETFTDSVMHAAIVELPPFAADLEDPDYFRAHKEIMTAVQANS